MVEVRQQVDAEVERDDPEGQRAGLDDAPEQAAEQRPGQQAGKLVLDQLHPRLQTGDHFGTEVGPRQAAGDQLRDDRDVAGLQVLPVQVGGHADPVLDGARAADGLPVAGHALRAGAVEGGEQQVVQRPEVVEDQRLVEVPPPGDGPGTRPCKSFLLQGLQGRGDNALLRRGGGLIVLSRWFKHMLNPALSPCFCQGQRAPRRSLESGLKRCIRYNVSARMPQLPEGGRSYQRLRRQSVRGRAVVGRDCRSRMDGPLNARLQPQHPALPQGPPKPCPAGSPPPGGIAVHLRDIDGGCDGDPAARPGQPRDRPQGTRPRAPAGTLAGGRLVARQRGPQRAPYRLGDIGRPRGDADQGPGGIQPGPRAGPLP